MILLCHRIRKYPDSPVHMLSDSLWISFFLLWRVDLEISRFAVDLPDVCGQKPYSGRDSPVHMLSDSLWISFFLLWRVDLEISRFAVEFARRVWTEAIFGKKKLRIQEYSYTCGWGLSISRKYSHFYVQRFAYAYQDKNG